jgi:hypothetical protein
VDISLDETYDILEELSFEESDAHLEILTAED